MMPSKKEHERIASLKQKGIIDVKKENEYWRFREEGKGEATSFILIGLNPEKYGVGTGPKISSRDVKPFNGNGNGNGRAQAVYSNGKTYNGNMAQTRTADPLHYNILREFLKTSKGKVVAFGLASIMAASTGYLGARTLRSGPSASDIHKVLYSGIDEKNWTSESNRQQHIKNLEARLSAIRECKDLGDADGTRKSEDQLNDYISTVEGKDPTYAPTLKQKLGELKQKYKL